jgi:hypothetical protein
LGWGCLVLRRRRFDILVGNYLDGDSWSTVLAAYDLSQDCVWGLVLALITVGPWVAGARRLRCPRQSRQRPSTSAN